MTGVLAWRTCGLCYVIVALGAAFILEQPRGSVLEYYPTFRQLLVDIYFASRKHSVASRKQNHTVVICNAPNQVLAFSPYHP